MTNLRYVRKDIRGIFSALIPAIWCTWPQKMGILDKYNFLNRSVCNTMPCVPTNPSFREYLTNPEGFLDKTIRPMGYKTCHALNSSLDATACAEDCDRFENQKFAKDCKLNNGVFKCCIRRDKAFCNECRFWTKLKKMQEKIDCSGFAAHFRYAPIPQSMDPGATLIRSKRP